MGESGGTGAAPAPQIVVRAASETERPLIEGLAQFYFYDWSEMEPASSADFEFDGQGRFGPYPDMEAYWRAECHWPLLIQSNGRAAGFALVNAHSHRGGLTERNMGEFFVARKHRRRGIATEAVRQILALHPGDWEIAIAERNAAAKAFWPAAIAAADNVTGLTLGQGDGEHWRGPIWSFRASAAGPPTKL